ncbi:DNA polymerase III subunit delta' [Buchnera aphidicola (Cinara splendens)]|uniref:DNA polymerase III subunit delta' n=1 Tax=Buchnera aphidicola (Cinara splendens) TaxID=2518979 RepID=A0A451DEH7_9GAMM|nr:DNA polymerase III subunit delta' C-terminal domain-containing protein [Buchnera aphidicola]VFP84985.1 DNA polymerase III subunit delta' [Buchnera aphidicola (Cinara splendens)]
MNKYPWLITQYLQIINKYRKNSLHPITLIQAPTGVGISKLIFNISKWILCSHKNKFTNCKKCISCFLINKKNHPDFYNVNYISQYKNIGINIIRNIIKNLYKTSQQGGCKIVYFSNINSCTLEASNALLKTLEEPPINTIFFLHTRNITQVINTIKSRSIIYYIHAPQEKIAISWLKKKNKQHNFLQLLTALRINNNAPISTQKFLKSNAFKQRNIFMRAIHTYVNEKNDSDLWNIILDYDEKIITTLICYFLLDIIKYNICKDNKIKNVDQLKLIKKIAHINKFNVLKNNLISWIQFQQILSTSYQVDKQLIFIEQIFLWMKILHI